MKNLNVISLFSGVGGTCLAFKTAGFNIVVANEIDQECCKTYKLNFPNTDLIEGCIVEKFNDIKKYSANVIIAGFPCQSFSRAGKRLGLADARSGLIEKIFELADNPEIKCVFLENVKGLLTSNRGVDFHYIISKLEQLGFNVSYKLINAFICGYTRQMRERIYIVAVRNKIFKFSEYRSKEKMRDVDFNCDMAEFEYTKEKHIKYFSGAAFDLGAIKKKTFSQIRRVYLRKLSSCPTLTANMGTGGHNVPIIKTNSGHIRKLSPRECFDLMAFPKSFRLPNIANCHLYKQAGNSVIVTLVQDIAKDIAKIL